MSQTLLQAVHTACVSGYDRSLGSVFGLPAVDRIVLDADSAEALIGGLTRSKTAYMPSRVSPKLSTLILLGIDFERRDIASALLPFLERLRDHGAPVNKVVLDRCSWMLEETLGNLEERGFNVLVYGQKDRGEHASKVRQLYSGCPMHMDSGREESETDGQDGNTVNDSEVDSDREPAPPDYDSDEDTWFYAA